jgi:tRNA U34 5-carboxymethylaminomethyl modifying GTPase MnmE/TrmE
MSIRRLLPWLVFAPTLLACNGTSTGNPMNNPDPGKAPEGAALVKSRVAREAEPVRQYVLTRAGDRLLRHRPRCLGVASEVVHHADEAKRRRERQRLLLEEASEALKRAAAESAREDIFAEELRLAARALGRLTGRVDVEDILDVIFRDFCIGK